MGTYVLQMALERLTFMLNKMMKRRSEFHVVYSEQCSGTKSSEGSKGYLDMRAPKHKDDSYAP